MRERKRTVYDAELRRLIVSLEKRGCIVRVGRARCSPSDPVVNNASIM